MTLPPSDSPDWTGIPGSVRFLGSVSVTGVGVVANTLAFAPASYDGAVYIVQDDSLTGALYPKLVSVQELATGLQTLDGARPARGDPPMVAFVSSILGASWGLFVQADFTGAGGPVTATWYLFAVPSYPLVTIAEPVNPIRFDLAAQSLAALTAVQDASAAAAGAVAGNSQPGAGVKATVTLPAVAGFVYVVDSFSFRLMGRGAADIQIARLVSAGAGVIWQARMSVQAIVGDKDEWSLGPGLGLTANLVADALTADFVAAPGAANFEIANINAYLRLP